VTRYLFIGGLHRSGTSLLARLVAAHPSIGAISGSPAPENEGCYLQGAIPHTAMHGRPMHFATDPDQHFIEGCRHDSLAVRQRMEFDWSPWFGYDAPWRLEKSPVNLTRMRLYQQLFPMSQFVVILRHPELVAAAVSKWVEGPPAKLVDHWIEAHEQLLGDLPFLHAVCVIRYEDLCRAPEQTVRGIHEFMGLEPKPPETGTVRNGNADYDQPTGLGATLREWQYAPGGEARSWTPIVRHPLRSLRERSLATLSVG
jgi:hypothetical protein